MKNLIYKLRLRGFYKFQIKILFSILLLISVSSCDDFIEVTPEDRIDADAFFSNVDELVFAVNGVYASQRSVYGNNLYFNTVEARTDNVGLNRADQAERINIDTFEEVPGNLTVLTIWTQSFIIINNANNVIARGLDVPFDNSVEEALKKRSIGEAKFLRAMSYFTLVNLFGDLPLRVNPTTDFDNADIPRSPVSDVYDLIVNDLTDAASELPLSYAGGAFNEVGRATRYAAQSLLGKVHLQNGNSPAASTALETVIGQYELLSDYASIYAAGNDNTAESIFELSFNPTNQTGLGLNNQFIPASEAVRLGIVAGGFAGLLPASPTDDIQSIYEPGDLRAAASFTSYDNNGSMDPYISKYIDLAAAGDGSDINLILLRYADALLMKAEADGENAASYELINQVRRRAFGGDPSVADPAVDIDAATPGTFLEKVILERRRELVFENQRWLDITRLPDSEALSIINNHLASEYPEVPTVADFRLIYAIPQTEIDVSNGVVTQNPGY